MKLFALIALIASLAIWAVFAQEEEATSQLLLTSSSASRRRPIIRPTPKPVDKCPVMRCMYGCKNSQCISKPIVTPPTKPPTRPPGCQPCPPGRMCIAIACIEPVLA